MVLWCYGVMVAVMVLESIGYGGGEWVPSLSVQQHQTQSSHKPFSSLAR
jgi:hypothetical protein